MEQGIDDDAVIDKFSTYVVDWSMINKTEK
jgi:hypothetical protein